VTSWFSWWVACSVAFVALVAGIATKRPDLVRRWEVWTQRPETRRGFHRLYAGILLVGLIVAVILGWYTAEKR
jgi:heme A synthase